jgi:hypothetical protein
MVIPVQGNLGVPGSPDAEIEFALRSRGGAVEWVFPEELERVSDRTPTMEVNVYRLATDIFLAGEINRIGDPLFRDLLRLSALTGSELALIPVQIRFREAAPADPENGVEAVEPAIELVATLVEVSTGRVLWYSILEGDSGRADDPAALASLADRLARTMVP